MFEGQKATVFFASTWKVFFSFFFKFKLGSACIDIQWLLWVFRSEQIYESLKYGEQSQKKVYTISQTIFI